MRLWQDKRQKKWAVVLGRTLRTAQSSSHQQLQAALADAAAMGPPSPMNRGPRGRLPLPALLLPGPLNASTCWIRHRLAVLRQPPTAIAAVGKAEREPRECWSSIEAEGKRAGGLRWGCSSWNAQASGEEEPVKGCSGRKGCRRHSSRAAWTSRRAAGTSSFQSRAMPPLWGFSCRAKGSQALSIATDVGRRPRRASGSRAGACGKARSGGGTQTGLQPPCGEHHDLVGADGSHTRRHSNRPGGPLGVKQELAERPGAEEALKRVCSHHAESTMTSYVQDGGYAGPHVCRLGGPLRAEQELVKGQQRRRHSAATLRRAPRPCP